MDNLKVPPYNLEAEQSVLGSMLLSKDAVIVATEQLQPKISTWNLTDGFLK